MAGYDRKYAIRALKSQCTATNRSQRPERRIYNEAVITALTIIWEAAKRICGKRLKPVLTTFVEFVEHRGARSPFEFPAATLRAKKSPADPG